MKTTIEMIEPFNGFFLQNSISFGGRLCLITGGNGVGKTRFLKSISNGLTNLIIDEENIHPNQISMLSIRDNDLSTPFAGANAERAELLSKKLIPIISAYEHSKELPEEYALHLSSNLRVQNETFMDIRGIVSRAELLLNKEMKNLTEEELYFSITAGNETVNGRVNKNDSPIVSSLPQLTVNYHKSIFLNDLLQFRSGKGHEVNYLSDEALYKTIGKVPPNILFNELLSDTFRGKFKLSTPDPRNKESEYNALLLNANDEIVNIGDLSDGEKMLFWLTCAIFACIVSKPENIFGRKKLILLDEPDNQLHPKMIVDFYKHISILTEKLDLVIIFTSHSPTTAALFPLDNFFNISHEYVSDEYSIIKTTKDGAISRLLEGVTQISINPDNARQVYVENERDRITYQTIYNELKKTNTEINEDIPLHFISAGIKPSQNFLENAIKPVITNEKDVQEIISRISGAGNCEMAIGSVEYHMKGGSKTVRALIDWDCDSKAVPAEVVKFAEGKAYSIENIIYDPLSIYAFLSVKAPHIYCSEYFLDGLSGFHWSQCINNTQQCQTIIDKILEDILERKSNRDYEIEYVNGMKFSSDMQFHIPANNEPKYGHLMEEKILKKYPCLGVLKSNRVDKTTMYNFFTQVTLSILGPSFISVEFKKAFLELQLS